jgi:hypothetical protein
MKESKNFGHNNDGIQLDLTFNNNEVSIKGDTERQFLDKERESIAKKYHILLRDPSDLIKREDGGWNFKGVDIVEYDNVMNGNDSKELYKYGSREYLDSLKNKKISENKNKKKPLGYFNDLYR